MLHGLRERDGGKQSNVERWSEWQLERANQQKTEVEKERDKVRYSKHVEEDCNKKIRREKNKGRERKTDSVR